MTDRTDIKALREKFETLSQIGDFYYFSKDLLDQLEAERQRVDAKDNAINFATEIARKASDKIERLEAEIAALKGDQMPVRYMAEWSSQYGGMEYDYSEVRSEMDEVAAEHDGSVIELFTATQKPVVLPGKITRGFVELAEMYGCEPAQAQFIAVGWNAAIEAAGGIVSTSDERLMQDMSGIVKDGE